MPEINQFPHLLVSARLYQFLIHIKLSTRSEVLLIVLTEGFRDNKSKGCWNNRKSEDKRFWVGSSTC